MSLVHTLNIIWKSNQSVNPCQRLLMICTNICHFRIWSSDPIIFIKIVRYVQSCSIKWSVSKIPCHNLIMNRFLVRTAILQALLFDCKQKEVAVTYMVAQYTSNFNTLLHSYLVFSIFQQTHWNAGQYIISKLILNLNMPKMA